MTSNINNKLESLLTFNMILGLSRSLWISTTKVHIITTITEMVTVMLHEIC